MTKPLYYLPNARSQAQYDEMVRLEAAGICIFCPEHLGRADGKSVILANSTWSLTVNDYPYEGTLHHWLLIPRQHVEQTTDLSPESRLGYFDLIDKVVAEYGLGYFGLGNRNGDPRYTGATIRHLHVQLIVSDPEHTGEPVKLFLSSHPSKTPPFA